MRHSVKKAASNGATHFIFDRRPEIQEKNPGPKGENSLAETDHIHKQTELALYGAS